MQNQQAILELDDRGVAVVVGTVIEHGGLAPGVPLVAGSAGGDPAAPGQLRIGKGDVPIARIEHGHQPAVAEPADVGKRLVPSGPGVLADVTVLGGLGNGRSRREHRQHQYESTTESAVHLDTSWERKQGRAPTRRPDRSASLLADGVAGGPLPANNFGLRRAGISLVIRSEKPRCKGGEDGFGCRVAGGRVAFAGGWGYDLSPAASRPGSGAGRAAPGIVLQERHQVKTEPPIALTPGPSPKGRGESWQGPQEESR